MHRIIELPASAKVILCFCTPDRASSPVHAALKVFCLMSTHPSTDLPLFAPAPCSRHARRNAGQPQPPGDAELWPGQGREGKRGEGKGRGMKGTDFCLLRSSQEERKITA